jgi:hypothetical protein
VVGCESNGNQSKLTALDFYKSSGYYEIKENDFVSFEYNNENTMEVGGHILIKANSTITLHLNKLATNEKDYSSTSKDFAGNFSNSMPSGFEIYESYVRYDDVENMKVKITSDLAVKSIYLDYEIIGAFVYSISDFNENSDNFVQDEKYLNSIYSFSSNKIETTDDFLFFSYFDTTDFENVENFNFISNSYASFNLSKNGETFELKLNIEIPIETEIIYVGVITKDTDNFVKFETISCSENSGIFEFSGFFRKSGSINKITINASPNLSINDEYKK